MTLVAEPRAPVDIYPYSADLSGAGYLALVRSESDPARQLVLLSENAVNNFRCVSPAEGITKTDTVDELINFALDSTVTSNTVRLQALERAIELGYGSNILQFEGEEKNWLKGVVRSYDASFFPNTNEKIWHDGLSYDAITKKLLKQDGIDQSVLYHPLRPDQLISFVEEPDENPVLALVYLDRFNDELMAGSPSPEAIRLAPLINDIQKALADSLGFPGCVPVAFRDWRDILADAELVEYGPHYSGEIYEILTSSAPLKREFLYAIAEMYHHADRAASAFPGLFQEGAKKGMQNLLADAVYAVHHHIAQGGETHERIHLKDGDEGLRLDLTGDEPYQLLAALRSAFKGLEKMRPIISASSDYSTTVKVKDGDFSVYRFMEGGQFLPMSLHIRPYASKTYDTKFEYGIPEKGVEATININIDAKPDPDGPIELGKHVGDEEDTRISIRLDREGIKLADRMHVERKDPTAPEGMVSIDISAIIGNDNWLGTKLARFLAFGNELRTNSQGDFTDWNHMRVHFTDEDGDAAIFGSEATKLIQELDQQSITEEEAKRLFAGYAVLQGMPQ